MHLPRILFILGLALLLAAGGAATAQTDTSAMTPSEVIDLAQERLDAQNALQAWRLILEATNRQESLAETNAELLQGAATALVRQARTWIREGRVEQGVEAAELLQGEASQQLVETVYPEHVEEFRASVREIIGNGYLALANTLANRGQNDAAIETYFKAVRSLPDEDPRKARAWYDAGVLMYEHAIRLTQQNNPAAANLFDGSAQAFDQALALAQPNTEVANFAAQNRDRSRQALGQLPPALNPQATPTPEPGFLDSYLPEGLSAKVRTFFSDLGGDEQRLQTLMIIAVALGTFVFVYWIIPNFALHYIATHYDVNAAEYKMKVKRLGIFALLLYALYYQKNRKVIKAQKARSGCPHCGFNLESYDAYDDLVFSRCPKCKGQITPVITLEGYIKLLAKQIAATVDRVNSGAESVERVAGNEAMVRLVRAIITLGVRRRASDLHVEPDENALVIRQRVDGLMSEMFELPRPLALALVSAIKVQANLNIAERRIPQDGKLSLLVDKTSIDIRIASSPASAGEKVSMRLLDIRSIQLETKHLGMAPKCQEMFDRIIKGPHGLMLVAGPTGSGKTTTLYVALQQIRPTNRNIISIEDPIEFRIPGVNQIQIDPKAGLTFASVLRSVLRQDPDVIMVGEIRDKETAEISVNSATTGHLVLSTLHTIDASASVARLIDLGVQPRQFADALQMVIAQRLIRLVCQYCPETIQPSLETLNEIGLRADQVEEFNFRRGKGCNVCNNTGYYRRTGIFEVLTPTERLRIAMEQGSLSTGEIRDLAVQGGMSTLRHEALELLKRGLTTAEETLRVTK